MRFLARVAVLGAAFGLATFVVGWWAVPVLGGAWGAIDREDRWAASTSALSAVAGWGALLLWDASHAAFAALASRVGGTFGAPAVLVVVATLLLGAALAWGSAAVAAGLFGSVTDV